MVLIESTNFIDDSGNHLLNIALRVNMLHKLSSLDMKTKWHASDLLLEVSRESGT